MLVITLTTVSLRNNNNHNNNHDDDNDDDDDDDDGGGGGGGGGDGNKLLVACVNRLHARLLRNDEYRDFIAIVEERNLPLLNCLQLPVSLPHV